MKKFAFIWLNNRKFIHLIIIHNNDFLFANILKYMIKSNILI